MYEDSPYLLGLSPVQGRRVDVAFDGGLPSSDGSWLPLREVERKIGASPTARGLPA